MLKHSIRQKMLGRRRNLSVSESGRMSLMAQNALVALPLFVNAESIALYAAIHNEVETKGILEIALTTGKTVLYPAVQKDLLVFRGVSSMEELLPGKFSIPEPLFSDNVWQPEKIDMFVIPGVAFDLLGKRIGYGRGYYDKTLHELEGCGKLVGFCYDFQLLDEIFGEPHDVVMDMIVTESRVIFPRD